MSYCSLLMGAHPAFVKQHKNLLLKLMLQLQLTCLDLGTFATMEKHLG